MRQFALRWVCFLAMGLCGAAAVAQSPASFEIRIAETVAMAAADGRVLLYFSQREDGQPMRGMNWFNPPPFFGTDVQAFGPGSSMRIDATSDGFPASLSQLPAGTYRVQAIFDWDFDYPTPSEGDGNVYCDPQSIAWDPLRAEPYALVLDQVVRRRPEVDTEWVKFLAVRSPRLSEFHGREVLDRAAVVLPASYYAEPQRRYPVFYEVSGFGGSLRMMAGRYSQKPPTAEEGEAEFIRVMLTGECKWGHHVYANSATNGPRGDALVDELIPYIDANFRTVADPRARFLGGHSSGGWSSLWLQVRYPDTFGGVWSSSPDPVDFRDWQGTNLYAEPAASVFVDEAGQRRPLARRGTTPALFYDQFCKMDDVLGRGGQLRSFEAVFSPLDDSGRPARCWDRSTGVVDPVVVRAWQRYDISLILQQEWSSLREPLQGKIHVVMGDLDTFYLEGATKRLAERLRELGSDAEIEIVPGKDHGSVLTSEVFRRRQRQMSAAFWSAFEPDGTPKRVAR